jgi:hypothetical protein
MSKKIMIVITIWWSTCQSVQAQLVLNEIYASPPSGEAEWVEIYNQSAQPVPLRDWQIAEEITGVVKNHELINKSNEATIAAYGFWVVETTKVTLNNAGDKIYLFNPLGGQADVVNFPKLTSKQSYSRVPDGGSEWQISEPSKAYSNFALEEVDLTSQVVAEQQANSGTAGNASNVNSSTNANTVSNNSQTANSSNGGQEVGNTSATVDEEENIQAWKEKISFRLPKYEDRENLQLLLAVVETEASLEATGTQSSERHVGWQWAAIGGIIVGLALLLVRELSRWWQRHQHNAKQTTEEF